MHGSFRSCAHSSAKAVFGFLLLCVPLLLAQNATVRVEPNKDLPDAPMPVTPASPTPSRLSSTRPSFDMNRLQGESWMRMSNAGERPALNTRGLAPKESGPNDRDMRVAGRSPANRFTFEPIDGHANRTATHGATQWYTSHIPWAGPIVRRGLKISKAHPHITTVIKTLKPQL